MLFKDCITQEGCRGIVLAKVNKTLVNNKTHVMLGTPIGQTEHISLRNVVARGVIRIDEHQRLDVLIGEEVHQFF